MVNKTRIYVGSMEIDKSPVDLYDVLRSVDPMYGYFQSWLSFYPDPVEMVLREDHGVRSERVFFTPGRVYVRRGVVMSEVPTGRIVREQQGRQMVFSQVGLAISADPFGTAKFPLTIRLQSEEARRTLQAHSLYS